MFAFDQMDEDMLLRLANVEIDMAMVAAGVLDINAELAPGVRARRRHFDPPDPEEVARQARIRAEDIAAGRPVGMYCSYGNLVEEFGEEAVAKLSRGEPRRTRVSAEEFEARGDAIKSTGKRLFAELVAVRQLLLPDLDLADFRDGPHEFAVAVKDCVDRLFPAPSIEKLSERVTKARRKISMLQSTGASPRDREEIADYVRYVSWFIDRFDILDAPAAPAEPSISLRAATEYLRAIQHHLDKNKGLTFSRDTEITKYFARQEHPMRLSLTNSKITLVKTDGTRRGQIPANVQPDVIFINDQTVPIEEGDVIERPLPNGLVETFTVTNRGFMQGMHGGPGHYQVKFIKSPIATPQANVTNNYMLSGQNARVTHGNDHSTNAIDSSTSHFASWRKEITESGVSAAEQAEILARLDELEKAKDKPQIMEVLSKIGALAAKSGPLFVTFGKIFAWAHGIPA